MMEASTCVTISSQAQRFLTYHFLVRYDQSAVVVLIVGRCIEVLNIFDDLYERGCVLEWHLCLLLKYNAVIPTVREYTLSLFKKPNTPAATSAPKMINKHAKNCKITQGQSIYTLHLISNRFRFFKDLYSLNPAGTRILLQLHSSHGNPLTSPDCPHLSGYTHLEEKGKSNFTTQDEVVQIPYVHVICLVDQQGAAEC